MAQLVKKRRPGWVLLVVSALVASLFAVPAAAIDDDSEPNAKAATLACVGDATDDWMFPDVSEGHAFRDAINCLAYYGVTEGYGDGTFGPNNDVSNEEMILFMERAAGAAGADAEAVVGDFAMTGSDPVDRGDMALLIARLLDAATDTVGTDDDDGGTFTVKDANGDAVTGDALDYFADSRRLQNRVKDSAASVLYELGVVKGTGMGDLSPARAVNRGEMAAFITRALDHTTARPAGVTIQSHAPGEVTVSVRDAKFQPEANAYIDRFTIDTAKVGEAFKDDGTCDRVATVDSNSTACEIDALDPVTGLSGDYAFSAGTPAEGGTTVFAWTGDTGDKVEDGGEGLASINLTESAMNPATAVKISTDLPEGATRAVFGSTVTVTIQLVDSEGNPAGPLDGGNSYRVVTLSDNQANVQGDDDPTAAVTAAESDELTTNVYDIDASGKATFPITASDPDPTDKNNAVGDAGDTDTHKIDRVVVSFTLDAVKGTLDEPDISADATAQTIVFSDRKAVVTGGSIEATAPYLAAPMNGGSASNVVTVTVVDQYARPMRGELVRLSTDSDNVAASDFPVARRTDSSGTVRIGYSYEGTGSRQTLIANIWSDADPATPTDFTDDTLTPIGGAGEGQVNTVFNWVVSATASAANEALVNAFAGGAGDIVRMADIENRLLVVGGTATTAPVLVPYDDGDQFAVGDTAGSEPLVDIAAFEKALADDKDNNDLLAVSSFDHDDLSDVARFVLTTQTDT